MKYSTPELVVLGPAATLVLGVIGVPEDSTGAPDEQLMEGIAPGLDD
ncbi:MAG TPA: hypothetical protein VG222_02855 [Vicinamibacterales bacterium]|jgi:hypothetical protein|nr:hypothetical protein [Vicinamibacterales bacterium]